ncbi:MAG: type I 3-dehydroquinate dehydratase [Caldimicrobium sp.]
MFCVVLAHETWEGLYAQLEKTKNLTNLFEIRLDSLKDLSPQPLKELLNLPYKFICTFRSFEEGGFKKENPLKRWEILENCCKWGAYLVDFEWRSFLKVKDPILKSSHFSEKILFSYHNFSNTPKIKTLKGILRKASQIGIKWFKITTYTEKIEESFEFLTLINFAKSLGIKLVAFNMGDKVRLSRVLNLLLGSPFTYVFPPMEKPLAPGQMDIIEAKKLWEVIGVV